MMRHEPTQTSSGPRVGCRLRPLFSVVLALALCSISPTAAADDGAIYTTRPDGARVAYDIYLFKADIFLAGGPGYHAPFAAAGLPNGRYVFQVTDSTGKILLSTDAARCREFDVAGGVIVGPV